MSIISSIETSLPLYDLEMQFSLRSQFYHFQKTSCLTSVLNHLRRYDSIQLLHD